MSKWITLKNCSLDAGLVECIEDVGDDEGNPEDFHSRIRFKSGNFIDVTEYRNEIEELILCKEAGVQCLAPS